MARRIADATLALAGMFQAAQLVHQVACEGRVSEPEFEACLGSILKIDAEDVAQVYGGRQGVAMGLKILAEQFLSQPRGHDLMVTRYVVSVMHLERKLARQSARMGQIRAGIERVEAQLRHFPLVHENIVAALAQIYVDTVSTLTPRIIVRGEHGYLSTTGNANKVRALLLAAIRSAVLWRQCGGNRWQLLLKRRQIAVQAGRLLV